MLDDLKLRWAVLKHDTNRTVVEPLTMQAARRLPFWLRKWVVIDAGVRTIRRNEVVPEVPFVEVLQRLD